MTDVLVRCVVSNCFSLERSTSYTHFHLHNQVKLLPVNTQEQYMTTSMLAYGEKSYVVPNHHGVNANIGKELEKKEQNLTTKIGFVGVGVPF